MESLIQYITSLSYLGVAGAIFAESGLLIGIFLPGDSLLFTAGLLAAEGYFNAYLLIPLLVVAAVLGDNVGYYIGYRLGPKLFTRDNSLFFKRDYLNRTARFYERYGKKTVFLGRFVPIVRTLAPMFAGAGLMSYPTFFFYNVLGSLAWAGAITFLGYWLGNTFAWIREYLELIIILIIATSFIPVGIELYQSRKKEAVE